MGLFDKIKKATPAVGAATAAGTAAAAGVYASQAFAKDKVPDDQSSDSSVPPANQDLKASHNSNAVNPETTSSPASSSTSTVKVEASEPHNQVDESPESTYNPETGVTTRHYPNGNIVTEYPGGFVLTEYPDGTEDWGRSINDIYNSGSFESTIYEDAYKSNPEWFNSEDYKRAYRDNSEVAEFVETADRAPDGLFAGTRVMSPGETQLLAEVPYGSLDQNSLIQTLSSQAGMSPETTQLLNELSTAAQNGTLDSNTLIQALGNQTGVSPETTQLLNDLSTAAQNGTLDSNTLIQALGKQAGIPLDGQVKAAYEEKLGWEANYNKTHTGSDEIAPGVGLDSEASYNASFFAGAYSKGDAGAEWNSNQAHLHAHTRSMVGIEASQDASYKGTLNIEGVEHQPGVNANASTRAFAGAELEGQGDAVISKDAAYASVGGEAFAGAKGEGKASGALSVDGDDFARGDVHGGAWAGVGAEFNVDAGYQDGQFNVGMDMGAAYGVGYGYGYNVSVDAPGIVTHPDAVIEGVQDEVQQYAVEQAQDYIPVPLDVNQAVNDFSADPSGYMQQYAVQQVQEYVPVPQEVSQVLEVINEPESAIEEGIKNLFG